MFLIFLFATMNSHPFGYESGYNNVAGRRNYNENRHQGWNNQRWEEPQGFDQPSWQQPPPMDYQQPPRYAYEPFPQNDFGPPYSQAPYHQTSPYDPNPHPPYQPPYEPNEPYTEPPPFQHNYSHEPHLNIHHLHIIIKMNHLPIMNPLSQPMNPHIHPDLQWMTDFMLFFKGKKG